MNRLLPHPAADVPIAEEVAALVGQRHHLDGRPWVVVEMVAGIDGSFTDAGRSGGLGGPADRDMFLAQRDVADVIIAGAGTVRAEGYGPARDRPDGSAGAPICVVSSSLRLDATTPLFRSPRSRTIVATTEAADPEAVAAMEAVADVVVAGKDRVDATALVAALAERGHRHLLVEGGPSLNAGFVAADLLDEVSVTMAPVVTGSDDVGILGRPDLSHSTRWQLTNLWHHDSELLGRYVRLRTSS